MNSTSGTGGGGTDQRLTILDRSAGKMPGEGRGGEGAALGVGFRGEALELFGL